MPQRPNIVLISDDQHRYDCLEMAGWPVRTPNLARLADEGVWHRMAYSPAPLCMPARCLMHNGLYAHQSGLNMNASAWPEWPPTMAQRLQQAGYHTAAIGKLHVHEAVPEQLDLLSVEQRTKAYGYHELFEVAGKAMPYEHVGCQWTAELQRRGVLERYLEDQPARSQETVPPFALPEDLYMDRFIGDHAVDWLESYDGDSPFFLWAGLCSPHPPFDAPADMLDQYPEGSQHDPIDCPEEKLAAWRSRRRHYAAMVEIIDQQVGRLLDTLDRRGLRENTLVLFVSDHGEMLGEHGRSGKSGPLEPSIHVPMLARWPEQIPPGMVSDALVELVDLPTTCLDAAGVLTSESLPRSPGRSLTDHWAGRHAEHRPFAYAEDGGQFQPAHQTIRTPRWKYVQRTPDASELLFDLQRDPYECKNLAEEQDMEVRTIKYGLQSQLLQHVAATPPPIG